ncbi:MAG: hypothetical protein LBB66_04990 [Desulfovibrio sp.]|jgi:hypothetical protein|nr:hypothetical protein [Desulfovibrio sp.]
MRIIPKELRQRALSAYKTGRYTGCEPELRGLSVVEQCRALVTHLREDAPGTSPRDFLHYVLTDVRHGRYQGFGAQTREELAGMGIELVDADVVCHDNPQRHEPERTVQALLHLAALPGGSRHAIQTRR